MIIPKILNIGMSFLANDSFNFLNNIPIPSGTITRTIMVNAIVFVGTLTSGIFEQYACKSKGRKNIDNTVEIIAL